MDTGVNVAAKLESVNAASVQCCYRCCTAHAEALNHVVVQCLTNTDNKNYHQGKKSTTTGVNAASATSSTYACSTNAAICV